MALTSAMNSATSGLRAASYASHLISQNIANALTPGYGVRALGLASDTTSGGVQVLGETRHSNPIVLESRRSADAGQGHADHLAQFHAAVESLVGVPGEPWSISDRLASLDAELKAAASRPDEAIRLTQAVDAAVDLASTIEQAGRGVQDLRAKADRNIANQVDRLTVALQSIETLNSRIVSATNSGQSPSGLVDERQRLIDDVAGMIPVREVDRGSGRIALYTEGGAILIDGKAPDIGFSPSNFVTADVSAEAGTLSGLTLNGIEIPLPGASGPLQGGTLSAQFAIRDEHAVSAQTALDGLAADLITRFADPAIDASRAPGDPGLFTDAGSNLQPTPGLAQRLSVNAAVLPEAGGAVWRLRDGLGAVGRGDVGDGRLLSDLGAALEARQGAPDVLGGGQLTAAGLSSALASFAGTKRVSADAALSFASAQQAELRQAELAQGVDTDAELQSLMRIEQIYAANAQVLQTIDDMMSTLMRI